ncbi:flagellar motor switch protein FliG [uncultured Amnibacterium sp.]|uniref:flagellar motor switch protein FliG n=1 Tax=uncultured Amnibacterium sp. TaxID=1631851 RepID=UPI0035CA2BAF
MNDTLETPELTGTQKAALVLMNMSTERAAAVLRSFSLEEQEQITEEMARMRRIDGSDAEAAIAAFRAIAERTSDPEERTGHSVATELIEASFEGERAADLLERIAAPEASASFAFLEDLEPSRVVTLLEADTAETLAFVLVQLGPDLAAKILMLQESARRVDIAQAIATMGSPAPEAGGIVAGVLRSRARLAASETVFVEEEGDDQGPAPLRVQPLVDIMNHAAPADEGLLMEGLRERDGHLADEVRAKMLSFDDIVRLQDRDVQQMLRGIELGTIALALKGAEPEVATAITSNMSERNREALAEEAGELGRVKRSQVDEARNLIVRALRELAGTAGLELKKTAPEPGAAEESTDDPAEQAAEPEEEYVD